MQPRRFIRLRSPNSTKLGGVLVLELSDEDEAMRVAQKLARRPGAASPCEMQNFP